MEAKNKIRPFHDLLFWKGLDHDSLEYCCVRYAPTRIKIESVIVGMSQNATFRMDYLMHANAGWEVEDFRLDSSINGVKTKFNFRKGPHLKWDCAEMSNDLFDGCNYIDLPLTPFTNTLPIRRLNMETGESSLIRVIYIDPLEGLIKPVEQKYTRLSEVSYRYENIPNDFEAVITVDESGFVSDYPGLFKRVHREVYPDGSV